MKSVVLITCEPVDRPPPPWPQESLRSPSRCHRSRSARLKPDHYCGFPHSCSRSIRTDGRCSHQSRQSCGRCWRARSQGTLPTLPHHRLVCPYPGVFARRPRFRVDGRLLSHRQQLTTPSPQSNRGRTRPECSPPIRLTSQAAPAAPARNARSGAPRHVSIGRSVIVSTSW
jgi:hypothetical protein